MNKNLLYAVGAVAAVIAGKKYMDSRKTGGSRAVGSRGQWLTGDPRRMESAADAAGMGWALNSSLSAAKLSAVQSQSSQGDTDGWGNISSQLSSENIRNVESATASSSSSGWGDLTGSSIKNTRTMESATDGSESGWGRVFGPKGIGGGDYPLTRTQPQTRKERIQQEPTPRRRFIGSPQGQIRQQVVTQQQIAPGPVRLDTPIKPE